MSDAILGQNRDGTRDGRDLVDDDRLVCAIGTYHSVGATGDMEVDADFVHVLRFGTDGKIVGPRSYTRTHR